MLAGGGVCFLECLKILYNKIIIYKKEVGRRGHRRLPRKLFLDNFLPQPAQ
jgi:hypothetical protein